MSYSGMFSTARARKVELKNTTIVTPIKVSEDVMDLDENQRINLDVLLRCEDEEAETLSARRQAFLYE